MGSDHGHVRAEKSREAASHVLGRCKSVMSALRYLQTAWQHSLGPVSFTSAQSQPRFTFVECCRNDVEQTLSRTAFLASNLLTEGTVWWSTVRYELDYQARNEQITSGLFCGASSLAAWKLWQNKRKSVGCNGCRKGSFLGGWRGQTVVNFHTTLVETREQPSLLKM